MEEDLLNDLDDLDLDDLDLDDLDLDDLDENNKDNNKTSDISFNDEEQNDETQNYVISSEDKSFSKAEVDENLLDSIFDDIANETTVDFEKN